MTDSPMFRQYFELKAQVPDAILFFRMGDFYELFFDDAKVAAEVLELTLTSRNKEDPEPIPMAGFPHTQLRGYLATLIERGFKAAVADQVEDPKLAKGLVKREILRVVSPALGLDPEEITPREPCWLAAACRIGERDGLALLDASTGDLRVTEPADLMEELIRAAPRELVLQARLCGEISLPDVRTQLRDDASFDVGEARRSLARRFGVRDLSGFGAEDLGPALAAAAAVLEVARAALRAELPHVTGIKVYFTSGHLVLDAATRRNLELFKPLAEGARGRTLIGLVDRSRTPMGGRRLREWIGQPLLDLRGINRRLDAVEALVQDNSARRRLREGLGEVADLERLAVKVAQGSANARDLVKLRLSLEALPAALSALSELPALADRLPADLAGDVAAEIARWLVDEPPASTTEGELLRPGVDPDLDELVAISTDGKSMIAGMEAREREATGIASLKIRYNSVFGYFIEISQANLHKLPDGRYHRKQTLANAERFITPELKEFEEKVVNAEDKRKKLEYQRFVELRARVGAELRRLQELGSAVAEVDAIASLAEVALALRWTRPTLDEGRGLKIVGGRHPVVEAMVQDERFVPNDLELSPEGRLLLMITGPNMSGKSTVMRQAAIIALLAQAGSFVPATEARIGLCDRIFTRVGASDDLAVGRSTFMVEMSETANILANATERSLVVLDEIGRGTSTYDGLAIAWAVAEQLHDRIGARTLFATHYHELVQLADEKPNVANASVAVAEHGDRIVFLRRLKEGGASRSYGIQCARLAGMPAGVVERARVLLAELERHASLHPSPQLSLFARPAAPAPSKKDDLREALRRLDPDVLSPREALAELYKLKALAES